MSFLSDVDDILDDLVRIEDSLEDLARLVKGMRTAQKRYFKDRTLTALEESKRLEREVDRWLEDWTAFGSSSA